jgi:hypothetical protein
VTSVPYLFRPQMAKVHLRYCPKRGERRSDGGLGEIYGGQRVPFRRPLSVHRRPLRNLFGLFLLDPSVNEAMFYRVGGSPRDFTSPNCNPPPPHPRITGELGEAPLRRGKGCEHRRTVTRAGSGSARSCGGCGADLEPASLLEAGASCGLGGSAHQHSRHNPSAHQQDADGHR